MGLPPFLLVHMFSCGQGMALGSPHLFTVGVGVEKACKQSPNTFRTYAFR